MKKRAKKLMALVLSLALVLGLIGTASATVGKQTKELDYNNITVTLNGKQVELKDAKGNAVEPFAIDGTTYIPVRAVAEALGLSADWDKINKQVRLTQGQREGITPGLVEFTVFGESTAKPDSARPQGQQFLVNKTSAKTYINPLCLPDYQVSTSENKGTISDDPFFVGTMIADTFIPMDPVEKITHERFRSMFRGTGTYLTENDTRASADPAAFYYNDTWYLYGTNGSLWVSKDFVDWRFVQLMTTEGEEMNFTAPTVAVRTDTNGKDTFYLAWNSSNIWSSDSPEGPFKDLGDFTYQGKSFKDAGIAAHNDVNIFVDDDGRMYLYWGMGPYISGAELNVDNPTELITEPKIIIEYDNAYQWQNFGQNHQDYANGFPEGAWMVKIDGKYYLTWATAGTQYDSYTMGCYQSTTGPLDGFELQEKEIINQVDAVTGTVRGGGHGSIVAGPNDTLWCFYTVNVGYEGDMERRLGCDPAMIDADGNLVVPHLSENPQYVPGTLSNPAEGNEVGLDTLSVRQGYAVSSYAEGRHPVYANDESMLTWWQPAAGDEQPWYLVSFKGDYDVSALRIIWKEIDNDRSVTHGPAAFTYKVEVYDGTANPMAEGSEGNWKLLYEKTSADDYIMDYYMADQPIKGQFARITITGVIEK